MAKTITSQDNDLVSSDQWFTYFKQLFSDENGNGINNERDEMIFDNLRREINSDCLNERITENEVNSSIKSLKGNCSPGIDGISIEMFKSTVNIILPYLTNLFNNIFLTVVIFQTNGVKILSHLYIKRGPNIALIPFVAINGLVIFFPIKGKVVFF